LPDLETYGQLIGTTRARARQWTPISKYRPSNQPATTVCNDCEWNASYNADFRTVYALLELIRRVFRFREVNLTPTKKASFGGYGIELDSALATVLGGREGQKISPSEMTKRIWAYVKHHNLGKKSN